MFSWYHFLWQLPKWATVLYHHSMQDHLDIFKYVSWLWKLWRGHSIWQRHFTAEIFLGFTISFISSHVVSPVHSNVFNDTTSCSIVMMHQPCWNRMHWFCSPALVPYTEADIALMNASWCSRLWVDLLLSCILQIWVFVQPQVEGKYENVTGHLT